MAQQELRPAGPSDILNRLFAILCGCCWVIPAPARGIDGASLALRSNGGSQGTAWRLDDNGYVGTYVTLAAPGSVTVTVNAQGQSLGAPERLQLVVGDAQVGWDVGAVGADYSHAFDLPVGTHFIRAEYPNAFGTQALVVNRLDVAGATVANFSTNANALAAADTHIQNYRRGPATIHLPTTLAGATVGVKLRTHAFNFGVAVPNSFTDTLLIPNPAPGSDAARFQQALVDNGFNSLTAENGGKWDANEGTRDVLTASAVNPAGGPNIPYIDRISDFAMSRGMRYRAHNVIWGRGGSGNVNQQPAWSDAMVQNPNAIDAATGQVNSVALRQEISERIDYYVADRAHRFYEVDVYNESYHTGSSHPHASLTYWDLYGASGVAEIYKEAKDAAGPGVGVFVNEYSVLQNQGGDSYANWYARHIESIQNAGRTLYGEDVVTGVGFQYYNSGQASSHNPARIYAAMQNLAVQGLPMHLTEWGATAGTEANAANVLTETARLVFGMPGTTGMTLWNLRNTGSVFAPVGTLYNADWSLRQTGVAWQQLMNGWDTDLQLVVAPDGTVDFAGFFGLYDVTIAGATYPLELLKGTTDYDLAVTAPLAGDFDGDGVVDGSDLGLWVDGFGTAAGATHDMGDADFDGDVDGGDVLLWQQNLGSAQASPAAGGAGRAVPEPGAATLSVALLAVATSLRRRLRKGRIAV